MSAAEFEQFQPKAIPQGSLNTSVNLIETELRQENYNLTKIIDSAYVAVGALVTDSQLDEPAVTKLLDMLASYDYDESVVPLVLTDTSDLDKLIRKHFFIGVFEILLALWGGCYLVDEVARWAVFPVVVTAVLVALWGAASISTCYSKLELKKKRIKGGGTK